MGISWLRAFAAGVLAAGFALPAVAEEPGCRIPDGFFADEPVLGATPVALARGQRVEMVALGGASTAGHAAGKPDLAWPARLAAALSARFPAASVTVANGGVARQTAAEMRGRLERDAIAPRPMLVVWETGTSDAVRGVDPEILRASVQDGIDRLRAAGIEVVLMDMQFSRRSAAIIGFDRYLAVLRDLADANDVPLFHRYDLMREWGESGVLDLDVRGRGRRRALAVRLYDCIGNALADLIAQGAPRPKAGN
jgi:lysophospholipase L1-like esterase